MNLPTSYRSVRPSTPDTRFFLDNVLKAQVTQPRVVFGTSTGQPLKFAVGFQNGKVVDRREPRGHEPVVVELPVLIAIGAIPVTRVVVPLICKPDRDPVPGKRPDFLD